MDSQLQFENVLKKKGIGPQGSKSLKAKDLDFLQEAFFDPAIDIITKATLMTAFEMLPNTEEESSWWQDFQIKFLESGSPSLIKWWLEKESDALWAKLLRSEDLSNEEAECVTEQLFDESFPDFKKASVLESLRLKRETKIENLAFLNVFYSKIERVKIDSSRLIDFADTYDGQNRTPILTPFVACLIASVGVPCILHGTDILPPKNGMTVEQILLRSGKKIAKNKTKVKEEIETLGVSYISQDLFFPELANMKSLRKLMVKRPMLATWEKLLQPVRAQDGNCIVVGYTHKNYRPMISSVLSEQQKCSKAIVWRGAEGASRPPISRVVLTSYYDGKMISEPVVAAAEQQDDWRKKDFSLDESVLLGENSLQNIDEKGRYAIEFWANSMLELFFPSENFKDAIANSLNSGKAWDLWNNWCRS
jgi:anthranilate phosphoribosyltransferase